MFFWLVNPASVFAARNEGHAEEVVVLRGLSESVTQNRKPVAGYDDFFLSVLLPSAARLRLARGWDPLHSSGNSVAVDTHQFGRVTTNE